jgi:opacity protein-like surface antigen
MSDWRAVRLEMFVCCRSFSLVVRASFLVSMGDERARGQTSVQFIDPRAHEDEDDGGDDDADWEELALGVYGGVEPNDVLDGAEVEVAVRWSCGLELWPRGMDEKRNSKLSH